MVMNTRRGRRKRVDFLDYARNRCHTDRSG
jgi:hypothetical protein